MPTRQFLSGVFAFKRNICLPKRLETDLLEDTDSLVKCKLKVRENMRDFPVQGNLGSWETRSHHATNLMQEVYWRESQNGSSLRARRERVEGWMEWRAFMGYLENVQ